MAPEVPLNLDLGCPKTSLIQELMNRNFISFNLNIADFVEYNSMTSTNFSVFRGTRVYQFIIPIGN